jgi:UDP-N-acetylmuramoyl-tripeptide--D-alanyl-D-alanine ligase
MPLLVVPDVLAALTAGRARAGPAPARVIGVTGSVGKTSTKEMLRHDLAGQGRSTRPRPASTTTGACR